MIGVVVVRHSLHLTKQITEHNKPRTSAITNGIQENEIIYSWCAEDGFLDDSQWR